MNRSACSHFKYYPPKVCGVGAVRCGNTHFCVHFGHTGQCASQKITSKWLCLRSMIIRSADSVLTVHWKPGFLVHQQGGGNTKDKKQCFVHVQTTTCFSGKLAAWAFTIWVFTACCSCVHLKTNLFNSNACHIVHLSMLLQGSVTKKWQIRMTAQKLRIKLSEKSVYYI